MTRSVRKMNGLVVVLTFSTLFAASICEQLDKVVDYQPQQIHIAYGGKSCSTLFAKFVNESRQQ